MQTAIVVIVVIMLQRMNDLVGALVGQKTPTEHQDDLDQQRSHRAEHQGHRQGYTELKIDAIVG